MSRAIFLATQSWGFLRPSDGIYILLLAAGALFAGVRYQHHMDIFDQAILAASVPSFALLGVFWRPFQLLAAAVTALSLLGITLYQGDLSRAESVFGLKFLLSSQTLIGWMCMLFLLANGAYFLALGRRSEFSGRTGSALTWCALATGFAGMMVRWHESYLIGADVGHIPVSNLYEVFVLFCLITAAMYLYYEGLYRTRQLGAFVLFIISAAVIFLLWYAFTRDAHEIQPLIPALQSYWMKIHVPANFIGYGAFAIAAMTALAWLLASRGVLVNRLPSLAVLDDVMYKAIAVGFVFFTLATILGALWAAEAWGTYWQWDPKETWALIVWLNYGAWLHMRLTKGLRGAILAWWSVIGLAVTTFAFLGVNMFLSGLHSYGAL
jgi:cytochrome c-type biogenesis protein CcsB